MFDTMVFFSRPQSYYHPSPAFSPFSPYAAYDAQETTGPSEEEIYFYALAREHERLARAARERERQEALKREALLRRQQASRSPHYASSYPGVYIIREDTPVIIASERPSPFESQHRQHRSISFDLSAPALAGPPQVYFSPRSPSPEQVRRREKEERIRAALEARKARLQEASRRKDAEVHSVFQEQILKALFGIEDEEVKQKQGQQTPEVAAQHQSRAGSQPETRNDFREQILRALFGIEDTEETERQVPKASESTPVSIPVLGRNSHSAQQPQTRPQAQVKPQPSAVPTPAAVPAPEPERKPVDPAANAAASTIQSHWRAHHTRTSSLTALDRLGSQFAALRAAFTFPAELDFPPNAPEPTLLYSSNNIAVLTYEHQLTGLLTKLDEVESGGAQGVRDARKALVKRVEEELEGLDRRKTGLWEAQSQKAPASEPLEVVQEEPIVAPAGVAPVEDAAAETSPGSAIIAEDAASSVPAQDPISMPHSDVVSAAVSTDSPSASVTALSVPVVEVEPTENLSIEDLTTVPVRISPGVPTSSQATAASSDTTHDNLDSSAPLSAPKSSTLEEPLTPAGVLAAPLSPVQGAQETVGVDAPESSASSKAGPSATEAVTAESESGAQPSPATVRADGEVSPFSLGDHTLTIPVLTDWPSDPVEASVDPLLESPVPSISSLDSDEEFDVVSDNDQHGEPSSPSRSKPPRTPESGDEDEDIPESMEKSRQIEKDTGFIML